MKELLQMGKLQMGVANGGADAGLCHFGLASS